MLTNNKNTIVMMLTTDSSKNYFFLSFFIFYKLAISIETGTPVASSFDVHTRALGHVEFPRAIDLPYLRPHQREKSFVYFGISRG